MGIKIFAHEYDSIHIENPFLEKEYADDKLGILDVKLHTKSGAIIDIEIQMKSIVSTFKNRIAFYGSKLISSQMSSGEDYSRLDRVICIMITDFVLLEENDVYHNRFFLYDKDTGATLTDILEIDTLEIPVLPANFSCHSRAGGNLPPIASFRSLRALVANIFLFIFSLPENRNHCQLISPIGRSFRFEFHPEINHRRTLNCKDIVRFPHHGVCQTFRNCRIEPSLFSCQDFLWQHSIQ